MTLRGKVSLSRSQGFRVEDVKDAVYRAIDMIAFAVPREANSALIKPNLCYYWDHSTGETTDPRVVSAVIDYLRDRSNDDLEIKIVESDASAMKACHAFRMLGYEKLAKEKSVELVNLSDDEHVEMSTDVSGRKITLPIPSSLIEADMLVNVPKLKTGPYASGNALHMTCALKNIFGCIAAPRKVVYHKEIDRTIVAVNTLIRPDLTVVDGIFAKGSHPCRLGLIMAGKDSASVDYVASKIMGYDPHDVRHLDLAIKEGPTEFEGVDTIGEKVEDLAIRFPKMSNIRFRYSWRLELSLLRLYTNVIGDVVPPVLDLAGLRSD